MQAIIIVKTEINLEIEDITLLSVEEADKVPEALRKLRDQNGRNVCWWLRSSSYFDSLAAFVNLDGFVDDYGCGVSHDDVAVRPALTIRNLKSSDLELNDQILLAGRTWTVISDHIILCDEPVGFTAFRAERLAEDDNDYEKSDVKTWLYKWADKNGILMNGRART